MALDGLLVIACALVGAGPAAKDAPKPTAPQPDSVTNTLAVQLAFQKGRDLLLQARRDQHMGIAELREAGTLGMARNTGVQTDLAHLVLSAI